MNKRIEFIESYIKIGDSDYVWNDNHGVLVRCKDCNKNPQKGWVGCPMAGLSTRTDNYYCSLGERREDNEPIE